MKVGDWLMWVTIDLAIDVRTAVPMPPVEAATGVAL